MLKDFVVLLNNSNDISGIVFLLFVFIFFLYCAAKYVFFFQIKKIFIKYFFLIRKYALSCYP